MDIAKQLTARLSLSLIASAFYFMYLPVLARYVGPQVFGSFSYTLQFCLFFSYLAILKTDFSSLYQGSKDVVVNYSIHQVALIVSFALCAGYAITISVIEAAIIFFLCCTHFLSSEAIRQENPVSLGVADCIYKFSLIVCSYLAVMTSSALSIALLCAIMFRLVYLGCLVRPALSSIMQISIKKAATQAYEIRWWICSQIIMLTSGFLPVYTLKALYTESQLGLYLLAVSLIGGAQAIIAKAVADVFYTMVSSPAELLKSSFRLIFFVLPTGGLVAGLVFVGALPTEVFLGEDWINADKTFSAVLMISTFGLLSNALDKFPQFYGFEWYTPTFNIFRLLVSVGLAGSAWAFNLSFEYFLWILCLVISTTYIADLFVCMSIIKRQL